MSSSQENQPSGRSSTSEPPQQDAITLFDLHLKFLSDSYLSFFLERCVYFGNMTAVLLKIFSIDERSRNTSEYSTVHTRIYSG